MDDENGMADYSDFEMQMVTANVDVDPDTAGTSPRIQALTEIDPLAGIGGLSSNEVAELVYLETSAYIESDDEVADQDVGTFAEYRGAIGVNLPAENEAFPASSNIEGDTTIISTDAALEPFEAQAVSIADNAYLQQYEATHVPPFDDEANGLGGGSASESYYAEKNWRQLTGRGPVFDQQDSLSILQNLVVGDVVYPVGGNVRLHAVWDVAEVDDAGSRFAVPDHM